MADKGLMPASACLPCLCSASLSKQLVAPDPHKPSDHPCLDMCPSCLMSNEHYAVCICPEPSSSLLSLIPGPQLPWNHTPGPLLPYRSQRKDRNPTVFVHSAYSTVSVLVKRQQGRESGWQSRTVPFLYRLVLWQDFLEDGRPRPLNLLSSSYQWLQWSDCV